MQKNVIGIVSVLFLTSVVGVASAGEPGWTTDSKSGCKAYNSSVEPEDSLTWSGSCQGGYASGNGTLQWYSNGNPGSEYQGEMRGGKRHGTGTYKWTDGRSYDGGWANNSYDGKGVLTNSNGTKVISTFADGKYTGDGVSITASSATAFVALDNEFIKQMSLIRDSNGCYVSNMESKTLNLYLITDKDIGYYPNEPSGTYTWKGDCINGLAQGRGELNVDSIGSNNRVYSGSIKNSIIYIVTMKNGVVDGAVSSQYGVSKGTRAAQGYYYYQEEFGNLTHYEEVKKALEDKTNSALLVSSLPLKDAMNYAKKIEISDASLALSIFDRICSKYQNSNECKNAAYHKALINATTSNDINDFMITYKSNDPDKLIPKAKEKLSLALKLEKQNADKIEKQRAEEATKREQEAQQNKRRANCEHLYIGRVFEGRGGVFGIKQQYIVEGFSKSSGRATIRGSNSDYRQEVSCSDIE